MRTHIHVSTMLATMIFGCQLSFGQSSATANATAEVIPAIRLCRVSDLQFGAFASGIPGTITISPSGLRSVHGPLALASANYPVSAATFTITGAEDLVYAIMLPNSVLLRGPSGSKMTVSLFVSDPANTGTLSKKGTATLNVGATLNVDSNQAGGSYSGTFPVTVTYQ